MKNSNNTEATFIISLIKDAWANHNKLVTDFFSKYDESYYLNPVATDRNRAIYLLGHLTVASDNLIPLLGFGDKLYPQLEEAFWVNPDKKIESIPTVSELRGYWENLNQVLSAHLDTLSSEEWLKKHTKVSAEDFAVDPKRNKLNAFLARVMHQNYHIGQLAFLKQKQN